MQDQNRRLLLGRLPLNRHLLRLQESRMTHTAGLEQCVLLLFHQSVRSLGPINRRILQ